ncbi:MAG: 16S rRNA (cytidine(1402)-2'-O)-methyltransferase [Candidatus Krumholzibacteria bacterium]|nr:16S rRNA (cytidine(1402)-2'-O)-methyltransferase [Candidatus Krumholzibacteria bacterium]
MKEYSFYLVGTPIGNLDDFSSRAADTLRSVDCVLAEDTRKTHVLLDRYGIRTPVRSYHDHNKEKVTPGIIREIADGKSFALVADAGTPLISDPGYYIARKLIEEGVAITAIPGACAITTALVLSGLPPDRFTFYGYVPRKPGERERVIEEAAASPYTGIFYESPHRLLKTLEAFARILPEREIVVARELTKLYEEVLRGDAALLVEHFTQAPPRGEITILVRGLGRKRGSE